MPKLKLDVGHVVFIGVILIILAVCGSALMVAISRFPDAWDTRQRLLNDPNERPRIEAACKHDEDLMRSDSACAPFRPAEVQPAKETKR